MPCSFPISPQDAAAASWLLCPSTRNGHSTQWALHVDSVRHRMSIASHFIQLFHHNESPGMGLFCPEEVCIRDARAPRRGQCTEAACVSCWLALTNPRLFPGVFCPTEMKRVLSSLASFAQWCSNESCALCQCLCLLRSSKMQRKINDAGKVPVMPALSARWLPSLRAPWTGAQSLEMSALRLCNPGPLLA